ncbi:MAG: PQQ-binding-like beta-propeller repeat protein [Anaerolineales bacterium]|jgi:outer membrane protein assembly factor BamB
MSFTAFLRKHNLAALIALAAAAMILSSCGGASALAASSWPGVTTDEENAYVAYGPFVRAVSLRTGEEQWHFPAEADRAVSFYAPPAIDDAGHIVVGGYDKKVYSLSPDGLSASILWTFEGSQDRIIGGPLIADGTVYVPSADRRLYALDLETGDPVWTQPFEATHSLWSAPLINGKHVYVAALDHHIYALNPEDGAVEWSVDLGSAVSDTPTLSGGLLLCGTFEGILYALDADSGSIAWTFEAGDAIWGNPAVTEGDAFFADVSGIAYSLSVTDGSMNWKHDLPGPASATPAIVGENVYFAVETSTVVALTLANGDPAWPSSATLAGRLLADPIVTPEGLLVPAMEGECMLYMVDPGNGSSRCLFQSQ